METQKKCEMPNPFGHKTALELAADIKAGRERYRQQLQSGDTYSEQTRLQPQRREDDSR